MVVRLFEVRGSGLERKFLAATTSQGKCQGSASGRLSPGYWHQASGHASCCPDLARARVSITISTRWPRAWPLGIGSKVV